MKKLPDFDDPSAMAAYGRRSAVMSSRSDACSELRDVATAFQSLDVFRDDFKPFCDKARLILDRLEELSGIAKQP